MTRRGPWAESALEDLADRPRRGFLTALARQAQEVSAMGVVLWAYEALRESASNDAETRALDQRITLAAIATGTRHERSRPSKPSPTISPRAIPTAGGRSRRSFGSGSIGAERR